MTPLDIIAELANTKKKSDKEQVLLNAYMCDHREFFIGAQLAFDPFLNYSFSKVPEITDEDDGEGDLNFSEFLILANSLVMLSEDDARNAMRTAAQKSNIPLWNTFYRRILLKDLKCVDAKTINKILKKVGDKNLLIPEFGFQTASGTKASGKQMLDKKLSGDRIITILDKQTNQVTTYNRFGKISEKYKFDGLANFLKELPGSMVLDGVSSDGKLAVFDIVPLSAFKTGRCETPQLMRHFLLSDINNSLKMHTNGLVYALPKVSVDLDTEEGRQTLIEFKGQENIFVKDPNSPYTCKPSVRWIEQ